MNAAESPLSNHDNYELGPNAELYKKIEAVASHTYGPLIALGVRNNLLMTPDGGDYVVHEAHRRGPDGSHEDIVHFDDSVVPDITGRVDVSDSNGSSAPFAWVFWHGAGVYVAPHEELELVTTESPFALGALCVLSAPDSNGLSVALFAYSPQAQHYLKASGGASALRTSIEYATYVLDRIQQAQHGSIDEPPAA